jgi:periplasmic protein TonB
MSAAAEMAPDSRPPGAGLPSEAPTALSDALRESAPWIVCFVVAAALHAIAAYALLERFAETAEDSGVDAPLVMLDLPEALAASVAPPQDLPPGPMIMQEETEQIPQPKDRDETKPPEPEPQMVLPEPEPPKPPEPESEVTLPRPEPPKPEPPPPPPPPEVSAPVAARTPPPSVVRWQSQLAAHIEHFKRYPQAARAHGDAGTATVAFTIDRDGHLLRSSIVQSSGSAALDQETLTMLVRAQPMPRPPDQLTDGELTFVVPVRFNIR